MSNDSSARCSQACSAGGAGVLWYVGWLFTVAFVKLAFWKALLALLISPYYLGAFLRGL